MNGPVGREAELEAVAAFLAAAASAPALLTIEGEPGMGKTTLCRYAVGLGRAAGFEVLECRPTHAESTLSFAGLTDLLSHVDGAILDPLPVPQRQALAVATLRAEPGGLAPDERAIATGLATLLTHLAATVPVLLVVDDAQWLDQPSLDALTFSLRRVDTCDLGVMVCRRAEAEHGRELSHALTEPGWHRGLALSGLSLSALFHIVRDELRTTLSRPVMSRITQVSGGNPYLALELARALIASGSTSAADLPVPESLQALHADRLGRLSPRAREAILAVACAARPTVALIAELGMTHDLEEAEAAGIISLSGARVEFDHPLLASATVELATAPQRRDMHARLHAAATDPEAKARHGALARPDPDDEVATTLELAVESASARGAPLVAADLARLALERTEDQTGDASWRRRVRLAELLHRTGATVEAGQVLEDLALGCPPGTLRARAWLLMTEVAYQTSSVARAQECATAALADAGSDAVLRAKALLSLATIASSGHDGARYAAEASRCLVEAGVEDSQLLGWAACEEVSARFQLGQGLDRDGIDRALALERTGRLWRSEDQVAAVRPALLKAADFHEEALAGLLELREKAEEEGNDGLIPYVVGHVPAILLRLGRVAEAEAAAAEHLAHAEATGQGGQRAQALYNVALICAQRGDLEAAEDAAHEILSYAAREVDRWMDMSASAVYGFVALSRDQADAARTWFDRWHASTQALGAIDPGISRFHGDHIEALVGCGALDEAAVRIDELDQLATKASRLSSSAVVARCRGLMSAIGGDQTAALSHCAEALELHERCLIPFERARTLLLLGTVQRRAKRKREAAETLAAAATVFAGLGASVWERRVASELARVSPRPKRSLELTVTERRVAELAASGLTNRQVADQAFISPKTVEANLARAYRKLGISSRAELGSRMAAMARTTDASG